MEIELDTAFCQTANRNHTLNQKSKLNFTSCSIRVKIHNWPSVLVPSHLQCRVSCYMFAHSISSVRAKVDMS